MKYCKAIDGRYSSTYISPRTFKIFDSNSNCSGFSSFKTWRAYLTALWGDFNLILFNESNSADLDIALPCDSATPIKRKKWAKKNMLINIDLIPSLSFKYQVSSCGVMNFRVKYVKFS